MKSNVVMKHWDPRELLCGNTGILEKCHDETMASQSSWEQAVFSHPCWANTFQHPRGFVGGSARCM